MNNAAKNIKDEIAANDECTLSDEMIAEVIQREKYIEQHPDEWISAEESIKLLRERNAAV